MKTNLFILFLGILICSPMGATAAGTLTPVGLSHQPMRIADHHVEVTINNGFARTEVTQTFTNPNADALEATFALPLPRSASLSEMSILTGERRLLGEVVKKQRAKQIYDAERQAGNSAGLGEQKGIRHFQFQVTPVPAGGMVTLQFAYYQPLEIDTGIGRYLYPLEEGKTDEAADAFWSRNSKVDGEFSAHFTLKSAWPIDDIRMPGLSGAQVTQVSEEEWEVDFHSKDAALSKDLVLYYRLADNLPGRVEVIPYKAAPDKTGTFMAVLTPGIDLKPLHGGADYVFVLDVSGSMAGKVATLSNGIAQSMGALSQGDRFRIVTFNGQARELTEGWTAATPENVNRWTGRVAGLQSSGGTNLYAALEEALNGLDNDRAASVILVTDGVTNEGIVDSKEFAKLLENFDARLFGFLLGNSANWPLMRTICEVSGGFYKGVSNEDDLGGQIMLAKGKVTHESLHHVKLKLSGVRTSGITTMPRKIYRGQQVVLFGRYTGSGDAVLTMNASITGKNKTYTTAFHLPETAAENPELERLWAAAMVEKIQIDKDAGRTKAKEADSAIADIGVAYQIVTDETAMIVLDDAAFKKHGIKRNNKARVEWEAAARHNREEKPVVNYRVDRERPTYSGNAPRTGNGGGALDPSEALVLLLLALGAAFIGMKRNQHNSRTFRDPELR